MDESSLDFKVIPAEESHAEELTRLYIEGYGGKYPLEEFTNPDLTRGAIREKKYCWMVGSCEGKVIGSAVGVKADWNNSFEHGRAIVYPPEFRGRHVIQTLVSTVVSACLNQGYDLGWFAMRDKVGVRFAERNDMGLVGFFPGIHQVCGRENQLLYIVREGGYRTKRVTNDVVRKTYEVVVESVEDALQLRRFGLCPNPEDYPSDILIGDSAGDTLKGHDFILHYQLEPMDNSILVGMIETDTCQTSALRNALTRSPFCESDYIQVDMLADKLDDHKRLQDMGFEMCAFLPTWFLKNGKRYDCIRFTKHSHSASLDEEVESRIRKLRGIYTVL